MIAVDHYRGSVRAASLIFPGVLFAITSGICWLASNQLPLLADNQHYFFIAERAASGVPPHISQFDPKHTLSLLMSALAMWLGRGVGITDVTAARLLSIAITAGSIVMLWHVTRRLSGSLLAANLAAVAMVSFHRFLLMGAMGVRPKVFLVFFALVAAYAIGRRRWFMAGLASAAAFLCWQPALVFAAVAVLVAMVDRRRGRSVLLFAVGLVLPNLVYEGYFWVYGALAEQIHQAYVFPARFMLTMPARAAALLQRGSWIFSLRPGPSWQSVVPLLSAVAAVAVVGTVLRAPAQLWRRARSDPGLVYVAGCGLAGVAFLSTNYQGFPDRFFVEPYMAIAAGLLLAKLPILLNEQYRSGCRALLSFAAVGCVVALVIGGAYQFPRARGLSQQYQVAEDLAHDFLDRGMSVYAVGCTHLLAFNHVNNFSKFGFFFRGVDGYLRAQAEPESTFMFGDRGLPEVVLVSRAKKRMGLRRWLADSYQLVDSSRYGRRKDLWLHKPQTALHITRDNREHAVDR